MCPQPIPAFAPLPCLNCPPPTNIQRHHSRTELQLLAILDGDYLSLMNENGDTREDMILPQDELGEKIREAYDAGDELMISILSAMGHVSTFHEVLSTYPPPPPPPPLSILCL